MLYLLTEPVGMTWTMHPPPHNPISISNDAFPIFHFYPPPSPHIPLCLGSTPSHQELTPEYKVDSIRGRLQIVILICGVSLLTSSLTSWPILTITSLDHLCSHLLHGPFTVFLVFGFSRSASKSSNISICLYNSYQASTQDVSQRG